MRVPDSDIMVIHLYRRDVDTLLGSAPPEDSPLWNFMSDSQRNLFDALENARVETYE